MESTAETQLTPRVVVLLATLNGARFLGEQLLSLAAQTWPAIDIWASDDGSTDDTVAMLEAFAATWSKGSMRLLSGPRTGSAADNFRHLLREVAPGCDYLAFCDQDDIWLPGKLEHAIAEIRRAGEAGPLLYCSRTKLIDEAGRTLGQSVYFRHPPDFRNALVQSIAGGNTMVLNRPAAALLQISATRTAFVSHDWWTYQIVTGAGGRVIYSEEPDTLYRQHENNAVGSNVGARAFLKRVVSLLRGNFRRWNDRNTVALDLCSDLLVVPTRGTLASFEQAREGPVRRRLTALVGSRVFRQTIGGQAMLFVACILRVL